MASGQVLLRRAGRGRGGTRAHRPWYVSAIMARRRSRRHNSCVDLPVNVIDLAVVGIVILAAVFGWRSGALPQVLGLAGAAAGVAVVILVVPAAAGALDLFDPPVRAFFAFGGAFLVVGVAEAVGSTLGTSMRDRLGVFPPPSDVAGQLGSLIDSSGLPQVFSGLEPQ